MQIDDRLVVRPRWSESVDEALPTCAKLLLGHYSVASSGRSQRHLIVPMIPPSLNHQYVARGRRAGQRFDLHPKIKRFRDETRFAVLSSGQYWDPKGITAAVIVFEAPLWVTKAHQVRAADADNKVKPVLDAVMLATGVPDELHFQIHVFKMWGKQERTHVYLFDIGDVVDACDETGGKHDAARG